MEQNDTKTIIIKAAMELFASKGYHETTMSDIVEKSNTSKGTLYYYFENKLELFETMINNVINRIYQRYERIAAQDIEAKSKLKEMLTVHARFYKRNYELAYSIFMEGQKIDADCQQELWRWNQKFNQIVARVMEEGIKNKQFKDKNIRLMTHSFLALTTSYGMSLLEKDYTVEELVDHALGLFLEGVSNGEER